MGTPEGRYCVVFGTVPMPLKSWHRFGVHFGLQEGGIQGSCFYPGSWEATQKKHRETRPCHSTAFSI